MAIGAARIAARRAITGGTTTGVESRRITMHMKAWNALIRDIVDERLVPAAEAIAAQCNEDADIEGGYLAGTEGELSLRTHDYRATVITVTHEAIRDNAKHNRLINNLDFGAI